MLRDVQLVLKKSDDAYPANVRPFKADQEAIWSSWADFFQPSSEQESLIFPVLEKLCLVFFDWELPQLEANKLRVFTLSPCQIPSKTCAEHLRLG